MAKYCRRCRTRYLDDALVQCPRDQTPLEPDPLVGWSIAGRRLDALIGEGAQAYVYRATHLELGRTEVVKVLKRATGQMSPHRFAREAQAMARMSSSHLVQVYDHGHTAEGEHFLVMEYVDGRALGDVLERYGRMPAPRALAIAEQVCLALAEAHRHDIIHRDVKPENVLLERRGATGDHARLVDFGVAHDQTAPLTLPGRIFGTPGYLAPEQLQSQPLDARSDLFGVGVLLYEMLSGHNPFQVDGETPMEQLSCLWRRLKAPVPPLSTVVTGVPAELDKLVNALMAREPNDRPGDAASVALKLVEIRLAMTGGLLTSNPSLKALRDELSEQARLLDARREALEARKRVLDRTETRVAEAKKALITAQHRAVEASYPPHPLSAPPQAMPPSRSTPPHGIPAARHTPMHGVPAYPGAIASYDQHRAPQGPGPERVGRGWLLFAAVLLGAVVSGTLVVAARYDRTPNTAPTVEPRPGARPDQTTPSMLAAPPIDTTSVSRQR